MVEEEKEELAPFFDYETRGQTPKESSLESTSIGDVEEIEGLPRPKAVALKRVTKSAFAAKRKADSSSTIPTQKRARV